MLVLTSIFGALVAATAVQAALPATSSSERITSYNATLKSAWVSDSGQGVFTVSFKWKMYRDVPQLSSSYVQDGLELLQGANGSNTTSSSLYVSLRPSLEGAGLLSDSSSFYRASFSSSTRRSERRRMVLPRASPSSLSSAATHQLQSRSESPLPTPQRRQTRLPPPILPSPATPPATQQQKLMSSN